MRHRRTRLGTLGFTLSLAVVALGCGDGSDGKAAARGNGGTGGSTPSVGGTSAGGSSGQTTKPDAGSPDSGGQAGSGGTSSCSTDVRAFPSAEGFGAKTLG